MTKDKFDFEIFATKGMPLALGEELFPIEAHTFGKTYERCPRTLEEYFNRYDARDLFLVLGRYDGTVVGHRTFEIVNGYHIQTMFMVVTESFRGLGLSNALSALSAAYLSWLGYQWVSSWTHVSITAAEILAKYAPLVSTDPILTEQERILLRELEHFESETPGAYGNARKVRNYYNMRDGRTGDAHYWVHMLSHPGLGQRIS